MQNGKQGFGGTRWRSLMVAAVATIVTLWTSAANATITQGDFSVFGFFESERPVDGARAAPRSQRPDQDHSADAHLRLRFRGKRHTGGSFDFNHWDLVEMRQLADIRPDYHMVKNYKFMGRLDTLVLKDADFFAFYRPWYDAEGTLKNVRHARSRIATSMRKSRRQIRFRQHSAGILPQRPARVLCAVELYRQLLDACRQAAGHLVGSRCAVRHRTHQPGRCRLACFTDESAENLRKNVRMVKVNYILPDFLKTANNEAEGFWIPGDFQAAGIEVQTDPRNPWVAPAALGSQNAPFALSINQNGQQLNVNQLPNSDDKAMIFLPFGPKVGKKQFGVFADVLLQGLSHTPSNSIQNSEFGFRYSSLLPIGNGLQASFIYLYEFRDARSETCSTCPASVVNIPGSIAIGPGLILSPGHFTHGRPRAGVPVVGSLSIVSTTDIRRNNFFGLTGTYYDKDLTDIVYRYDFLYQPDHAISTPVNPTGTAWTEFTRFIVAADRPTYIPWISKQHTFLTAQFTETWLPDRPTDAQSIAVPDCRASARRVSSATWDSWRRRTG